MNPQEIYLDLTLTEKDTNLERLDGLTVRLMHDLRDLGAESVERPQDAGRPPGVKGDPFTVGALLLVAIPAFLPKLVEFLQAWSMRGAGRAVKIKTPAGLEVEFTPEKTLSEDDLLALVDKLKQAGA